MFDMQPVSIIIPTYNREEYLERAVKSAFYQDDFKGEILIVDDGSTDATSVLLEELSRQYGRVIRCLYQDNKGPAAARNQGIEVARYELIAFLDSDDHWLNRKLNKQVAWMEQNPEYLICHTQEKWLRRGKHLNQKRKHYPRHGDIFSHCLQLCAVGMSTVMVRRGLFEKIGMFDERLPCCEDYDFWLRVSLRFPFLLLEEPLTVKEGGREDQVSYRYRVGMDKFRIDAIVNLLSAGFLAANQKELALAELRKKCKVYGKGCIKHGKVEEGRKYLDLIEKDWD